MSRIHELLLNVYPPDAGLELQSQENQGLFDKIYPGLGVRPIDLRVRLLEPLENYNPRFIYALYRMCEEIDSIFDREEPQVIEGEKRLFSRVKTREEIAQQQQQYIKLLIGFGNQDNVVIGLPMLGSFTIMDQLQEEKVAEEKLLPLWISGSQGTETGFAQIEKQIDNALLDPNKIVVIADDVTDTLVTITQFALTRRSKRLNGQFDEEFVRLVNEMQEVKREVGEYSNTQFQPVYEKLARLFRDEQVVLAPFCNKNQPALEAINELAKREINGKMKTWADMQKAAVKTTMQFGQHEWLIGGQGEWDYPMLDTRINGQARNEREIGILNFVEDPAKQRLINYGLDKLYLRLGAGIRGIVVFNPDGDENAYQDLVREVAGIITELINTEC